MTTLKKNYDRVFLALVAAASLLCGLLLLQEARALPGKLHRPDRVGVADLGPDLTATHKGSIEHLQREFRWKSPSLPSASNKRLPLLRGTSLYIKDGKTYDLLNPYSKAMRPPLDNRYLVEHRLPAERSDVTELDLDADGFTNAEEFLGGRTDPRDAYSHPPFTEKLRLAGTNIDEFSLTFTSDAGGTSFGIRETAQPFGAKKAKHSNSFADKGDVCGKLYPGRWHVIAYENKSERNPKTGALKNSSVLKVADLKNPGSAPLLLTFGQPLEMPTPHAVLHYDLPGYEGALEATPKIGERFELPNQPGVSYQLLDLGDHLEGGMAIGRP